MQAILSMVESGPRLSQCQHRKLASVNSAPLQVLNTASAFKVETHTHTTKMPAQGD